MMMPWAWTVLTKKNTPIAWLKACASCARSEAIALIAALRRRRRRSQLGRRRSRKKTMKQRIAALQRIFDVED
jgi:hypothetical protein